MTHRGRFQIGLVVAVAMSAIGLMAAAQQSATPAIATLALSRPVPIDPQITIGTLPNGLKYYIRANPKPEHKAELRLVVRAGSVLEDDDQLGLAHFVEHMAFEGTTHFPKQSVLSFLSSMGLGLGPDANAATSFDETIYRLRVPTDREGVLDRSLLILEDWAHNVSFDTDAIDRERGVVLEEWRRRLGAGARTTDKESAIRLKGSRYALREPIGTPEIIQGAKGDRLKQFYADWYRPDLMAVIAVGDFDAPSVETMIKSHFSGIAGPAMPRPRPVYDVPDHPGTIFGIVTDAETTSTSLLVENLLPLREQTTVGGYRAKIVDRLFSGMLTARYSELAQQADAPVILGLAGNGLLFTHTKEEATLRALVKDSGIDRGLDALLSEAARVSRFGFTSTELARQKTDTIRGYQTLRAESANRESASRADEYIRNFLDKETLPTIDDEYALQQRFLGEITLDEVNRLAKEWFPDRDRFVFISAPQTAGVIVPDAAKLAAVMKAALTRDLKPYVDTIGSRSLIDAPPAPGKIATVGKRADIGVEEWELSNGVKVILKPTTFKEDEIVFRATSPGGTSLASDQDFPAVSSAAQIIPSGGIGAFNAIDLRKAMTGKIASATPIIGDFETGMGGSSSKGDIETLLQLIYLRFTAPRADPTIFDVMSTQVKTLLANQLASPDAVFSQTLTSLLTQDHPRKRPTTATTVEQWNLEKSLAFYKTRFADASGFTFVIVGSFDPEVMKPLVERYLGALPSTHRHETWKDTGIRPPLGIVEKTIELGVEPKSEVAIVFTGPFEFDDMHRLALKAMSAVLQSRLLSTIREQLGGTYSINVSQVAQKIPVAQYSIGIQWACDPQRTADLVTRVFQEIELTKDVVLNDRQVDVIRQAFQQEFDTNSKQNAWLANQISLRSEYGENIGDVWSADYRTLTGAMIQQAARAYLNTNNYVKVTLDPAKR